MDLKKEYTDSLGYKRTIIGMVMHELDWAANRIQEGERAIKRVKELETANEIWKKQNATLFQQTLVAEDKARELEGLICIAYDYLVQHWEMDSVPLDKIKAVHDKLIEK